MTDLQVRSETPPALPDSSLVAWAQDASAAHRVAQSLVKTPFVPQALSTPEAAAAAILVGQELGLSPMAALRSIVLIQGTPAMLAVAMRGLVQSAGHDVWVVEQTDTRAVVAGRRRGSEHEQKSTWTIDRAHKLGVTSKQNWKNQPGAMLIARATSEVCRLIASDVLLGLPYSAEELDEGTDAPAPKRTARRKPVEPPPPSAEPDLPPPPADDVAEAEPIDPADYADMLPDEEK